MARNRGALLISILLLCSSPALRAADADEDTYGDIVDYLVELYGVDENAGLTTLPSLNVPMGGRAEAMATAFSAVADDGSFIEYNPAGSATLKESELSFFHNNWIADTKLEGAVYTVRFGDLGLGLSGKWLYLPFTEYDQFGERASKGYYSETSAIANVSYNFFRGYYFDGLSAGANLKTALRSMPDYSNDEGEVIAGSGADQSVFALMADFGLLSRFNLFKFYHARERNASVAAVVRNVGPAPLGEPLPTVAVVAASYRPIRPVQLSFDYSIPVNLVDPSLSMDPYWAAGFSVAVTDFLSMQGGFMIRATNPRITVGSRILVAGLDLNVNYTLDLLTQLQPFNRVSVSARFSFGDGGRAAKAAKVDDLYLRGLEAYAGGDMEAALELWQEALRLDPGFDPAKEGIAAVRGSTDLLRKMDEIQRLE